MTNLTSNSFQLDIKQIQFGGIKSMAIFTLFACIFSLMVGCASQTTSSSTIAEATAAPDGTQVVISGEIVQQVDSEHLVLRDNSGQINVEVDKDILGKVKFAPDSHLRILGKMDRNSERSLLVAKSVQVVQ